jgi:hypothetical protein
VHVAKRSIDQSICPDVSKDSEVEMADFLLNMAGTINVGAQMNNRQRERVVLNRPANLVWNSGSARVNMVDLSFGGVGVSCADDIKIGTSVSVSMPVGLGMPNGEQVMLPGTVVWAAGGRLGIQFSDVQSSIQGN